MTKVSIVTHTGCDMNMEEIHGLSARMVSDLVVFEDKTYLNMVEIMPPEFFAKMKNSSSVTSSHFPVGDMLKAMKEASAEAEEVLCLLITSKMSGCYSTAVVASQLFRRNAGNSRVYIYDTAQCSHGMAIMVREAARMAAQGLSAAEIITELDKMKKRIGVYFVLDSLKYARKGGRVGTVKMLTADLLGIKPLMVFDEGVVSDIGIARSMSEGMNSVADKVGEELDPSYEITVFHGDCPERAARLADMLAARFPETEIRIEYIGPVIGIFAGPGTVGAAFMKKNAD
ncbi:MAG: DegV family protein [Parasporobacterium sp.]|nr:DegV family protein [Parasporobacterium sp.]